MRSLAIAAGLACLVVFAAFAGCTSSTATTTPSYSVDSQGILSVTCAPVTTSETMLATNETYTVEKLVLHTTTGDVVTYLSYPKTPKAVIVYIPGAGEKITGHEERMVRYAAAGYAFMFVDTRGRGGETAGSAFSPQADYAKFKAGNQNDWPQFYLTICDISSARGNACHKVRRPGLRGRGQQRRAVRGGRSRCRQKFCRLCRDLHCRLGNQGRRGRAGRIGRCLKVLQNRWSRAPTCPPSRRALSGCSTTRPTRLSRLSREKRSIPWQMHPKILPSLMATTGSIPMSMPGS